MEVLYLLSVARLRTAKSSLEISINLRNLPSLTTEKGNKTITTQRESCLTHLCRSSIFCIGVDELKTHSLLSFL